MAEIYKGREHESPALRSRIIPQGHELTYWNAFATLHAFRSHLEGHPRPFTLSDIKAYCDLAGIHDPALRLTMARVMHAMDAEWFALRKGEEPKPEAVNGR